jgi:uncharacterized integral membrane protein
MRFLAFLLLLVVTAAIVLFAMENRQEVTLCFYNWRVTAPIAALVGVVYVLGMLTGWSMLRMVRRSFERATESRDQYAARMR